VKNRSYIFLLSALGSLTLFAAEIVEESSSWPFSWSITDHSLVTSAKDPGDPTLPASNVLAHQTVLGAELGSFSTSLAFSNRFSQTGDPSQNKPILLDKKTLSGEWENWEIRLGDSHQEFGRGIALALFNNPVFGVDNTLEGGSLKYRDSVIEVSAFGGKVNALQAPVAINPVDTLMQAREVRLLGGALSGNLTGQTKITAHYHLTESQPDGKPINKKYKTVGMSFESRDLISGVETYLESNLMDWEASTSSKKPLTKKPRAYASFASMSYSDLAFKTKLEFKDYRNFFYDFQRPPTLEEEFVLATNNSDVTAGRLGVEERFGEERTTVLGASYLTGQDRELDAPIYHPLVFSKFKLGSGIDLELKGGYRWMPEKNNLVHASLKTKVKTQKGQYVELELRRQNLNQAITSPIPIREERNVARVTYTFSEKFNLGVGYEHMPTNIAELGNHFVNGSATYTTSWLTARAFMGQTSGGTQCSSGVCRQVPPYTGAYLETTLTF
jgi:hypothetical protein